MESTEKYVCLHGDCHRKPRNDKENEPPTKKKKKTTNTSHAISTKITGCSSSFMLRLLTKPDIENEAPLIRQAAKKRLQRNPHLKTHRTELTIIWQHNHNIRTAEALRWNRISDETKRLMVEDFCKLTAVMSPWPENNLTRDWKNK